MIQVLFAVVLHILLLLCYILLCYMHHEGNGAMGHRIDPSWGGPIELVLVPASAPRLV